MPYSITGVGGLFEYIFRFFRKNPEFNQKIPTDADLYVMLNEALDEAYQVASPERDIQTFTTTVGDWDYLVGTDPVGAPITDNIHEIVRVDYDGEPLPYRSFVEKTTRLPDENTVNGTPSVWFELWKDGGRYLCFDSPPESAKMVRIWYLKKPDVIISTSDVPKLFNDFWSLLENFIKMKVYEWIEEFEKADYYRTRYIIPGLRRLKKAAHARHGRKATRIKYYGAQDLID